MKIYSANGNVESKQILARSEQSKKNSGTSFAEVLKSTQNTASTPPEPVKNPPIVYTVKRGDTLWSIAKQFENKDPRQIIKDNRIASPDLIYPGQKIEIYQARDKTVQPNSAKSVSEHPKAGVDVTASWYGTKHHNMTTSSGQRYDMHKNTVAHKTLPFGTKVKLVNPENGIVAEGVVNDRGPYTKGRDIDVSYALAKKLGFEKKGVTKLNVEIINPSESNSG